MEAETFRTLGHRLVDQLADFLESLPDRPVTRDESPSAVRRALELTGPLPEAGTEPGPLLERTAQLLFDHSLFNGHPRFFGYITAAPAPIGILGDLLAAGVNANVGGWMLAQFVAQAIRRWLARVDVETLYIEPGSPWENGYAESFHSRLRDEFLALEVFESLSAAKKLTRQWREENNHHRPHSSLGYVTPAEFAARCAAPSFATLSSEQHSGITQPEPS